MEPAWQTGSDSMEPTAEEPEPKKKKEETRPPAQIGIDPRYQGSNAIMNQGSSSTYSTWGKDTSGGGSSKGGIQDYRQSSYNKLVEKLKSIWRSRKSSKGSKK